MLAAAFVGPPASAQSPVVRAVLFFSPTCGHCEYVIDELLFPVWFPQYGGDPEVVYDEVLGDQAAFLLATNGTLEVLLVNVTVTAGRDLHLAVGEALGIPEARPRVRPPPGGGRPLLDRVRGYPRRVPGIIEEGLASGGIDWPVIPGIEEALASLPGASTTTTTGSRSHDHFSREHHHRSRHHDRGGARHHHDLRRHRAAPRRGLHVGALPTR